MNYWLLKSEPDTFSIEDLKKSPRQSTLWEGVRNYQARNYLRAMKKNDLAFFYYSNCKEPAIVGIVEVIAEAIADLTQFDPRSKYFDPKATSEKPRWFNPQIKFVEAFKKPVSRNILKEALPDMLLLSKTRLSVQPVQKHEWIQIKKLSRRKKCEIRNSMGS